MRITQLRASAYEIPTATQPESDGTIEWDSTTLVLVELSAGGETGLGYTYAHSGTVDVIRDPLSSHVLGEDPMDIEKIWQAMLRSVRNIGRPGLVSSAIAAVDWALWDLKAKILGLPLVKLLGASRDAVAVYGSGGFTSYSTRQLTEQLSHWDQMGIRMVKMKVGTHPDQDAQRVIAARHALNTKTKLFVDANGAYSRKQALAMADEFAAANVTWFEEPVSSDDLDGLHLIRDRAPREMAISAGEYGYDLSYFSRMLEARAVDVLQADATRCEGLTGFIKTAALCEAQSTPLSSHTAPTLHVHAACALKPVVHMEYFFDHVRIERFFFEGFREPVDGCLGPDLSRPGLGIEFKRRDAERFKVREISGATPRGAHGDVAHR